MGRDDNNGVNTGSAPPSVPAEIQQLAEMQKELNRVLNALALELPASVHQDAAGRIRLCCAAMRDVSYQLGVATERARGGWQPTNLTEECTYERLESQTLVFAIRRRAGERLLVLQPFGWHIDSHHIPNAAEQYSRESICAEYGWEVVVDYGPWISVVRPLPAAPPAGQETDR